MTIFVHTKEDCRTGESIYADHRPRVMETRLSLTNHATHCAVCCDSVTDRVNHAPPPPPRVLLCLIW